MAAIRAPGVAPGAESEGFDIVRRQTVESLSAHSAEHTRAATVSDNRSSPGGSSGGVRSFLDDAYWHVYVYARGRRGASMASVLNRRHVSGTGQAVKYTPCLNTEANITTDVEDGDNGLDEISVVCHGGVIHIDAESPMIDNESRPGSELCLRSGHETDSCDPTTAPNGPLTHAHTPGTSGTDTQILNAPNVNSDRTKLIGKKLSTTGTDGVLSLSSPVYPRSGVIDQKRNSVFDLVSNKIERVTASSTTGSKRRFSR